MMNQTPLPPNWDVLPLSKIAAVKYGKAKPKADGAVPVIGSGGVYSYTSEPLVNFPTVVVGRKGTAGMVWLQEEPCWPSDTTYYLDWKTDQADFHFVYLQLHANPLSGDHARTTLPSLQRPDLENYQLCLPPLSEQRAIARALRVVQEAREARRKELQLERERKAALMKYLFTHGTRGEARKQTEIGEMPESWRVTRLREVVTVKGGKRLPKGLDFAQERTPYPYIRIVDFKDGSVKTADLRYLTSGVQKQISRYTISASDVYISIAGTIGLVGVVPEKLEGANLTENAAKLVIQNRDLLDKDFLAKYLSGETGQAQIESLTAKTTQPKLALTRIEQILIPISSLTEQIEIADAVRACEMKLDALQQELSLLDELFRAMLEELMTGRLSTQPLIED